YHVVGDFDTVAVVFPIYRDEQLIVERDYYKENAPPSRPGSSTWTPQRDLAVIQLPSLPDNAVEVPLAGASPPQGGRLHALGNPGKSGGMWVYTTGTARQVYKRQRRWPVGRKMAKMDERVVESDAPQNGGDSGGPVVNDQGDLVAVTSDG